MNSQLSRLQVYTSLFLLTFCTILSAHALADPYKIKKDTIIIKEGIAGKMITAEWKNALASRMSKMYIDSIARLQRDLTTEEKAWKNL
ncbi:MAG TPA: hypothetical protein VJ111_14825, partial [Chitinophagaceae bacterium]|nr:hypothetical protein [Chitinophagaceae bacterium]